MMHEFPITRSLLEIVKEKAAEANAVKVNIVNVVIGELSGVEKDCISFYFDILKKEYGLAEARLNFTIVPVKIECQDCRKEISSTDLPWTCPDCSGINVSIKSGSENYVESIEVD